MESFVAHLQLTETQKFLNIFYKLEVAPRCNLKIYPQPLHTEGAIYFCIEITPVSDNAKGLLSASIDSGMLKEWNRRFMRQL